MPIFSRRTRTLTDGTAVPINVEGADEVTVTLTSAAVARLIRFATDGGTVFHTPVYDVTSASQLIVVIGGRPTDIEVTGEANDTVSIASRVS